VVADGLGRLFNKDGVVEYLLAKKDIFLDGERSVHQYANTLRVAPGVFDNLRSLKDVFRVHVLSQDHAKAATSQVDAAISSAGGMQHSGDVPAPYFCPVTGLPCNRFAFSALRSCGHVLSNRALACVSIESLECPVCCKRYTEEDVVPINGTREQVGAAFNYTLLYMICMGGGMMPIIFTDLWIYGFSLGGLQPKEAHTEASKLLMQNK
jgi:Rtf2 RING-finger